MYNPDDIRKLKNQVDDLRNTVRDRFNTLRNDDHSLTNFLKNIEDDSLRETLTTYAITNTRKDDMLIDSLYSILSNQTTVLDSFVTEFEKSRDNTAKVDASGVLFDPRGQPLPFLYQPNSQARIMKWVCGIAIGIFLFFIINENAATNLVNSIKTIFGSTVENTLTPGTYNYTPPPMNIYPQGPYQQHPQTPVYNQTPAGYPQQQNHSVMERQYPNYTPPSTPPPNTGNQTTGGSRIPAPPPK